MPKDDHRDPRTYSVIGAAMEVHRRLGCGFLEIVYQQALAAEFETRRVPVRREVDLPIYYKGLRLACHYRADFICHDLIIVELKALPALGRVEEAQVINYLRAARMNIALLINFGGASLQYKRFVQTQSV